MRQQRLLKPVHQSKTEAKARNKEITPVNQKLSNKASASPQNSLSTSIDLGLKKIIVERKLANSSSKLNKLSNFILDYSLRAMRKKITASNEEGEMTAESNWERPVRNKKPSRINNNDIDMDWADYSLPSASKINNSSAKKPPKKRFLKTQAPIKKVEFCKILKNE